MKNLRKLGTTLVLTLLLGLFAFAGETPTLACAPLPGQIETPPCAMAPAPDPGTPTAIVPGQVDTPPAAQSDASFTEIAASVLVGIMSLF